jgi:glycosyltransferase involved in cell wall biosynthesis
MKAALAIVTMVYNEPVFLPVWLRHYGAQAGAAHCYVVDHGSTDGSTRPAATGEASVIRIPRSPQDDAVRTGFIADFCASLLSWYDAVIYTDVDELLVADPDAAPSLPAFAAGLAAGAVVTAIGLDVIHVPDEEPALDWSRPLGRQRLWARFSSAMCKPVLIRRRVAWAPGFHCIDDRPCLGRLFLLPDPDWEGMLRAMAGLPRDRGRSLDASDPELRRWLDCLMRSADSRSHDQYRIDLHLSGDQLWALPDRLRDRF